VSEGQSLIQLSPALAAATPATEERRKLERQARLLAWGGIGYHVLEATVAVGAGLAAGSIALIGFGADSLIESFAGFVVLWLFTGSRLGSHRAALSSSSPVRSSSSLSTSQSSQHAP
jgi:hypothetical protein